MKKELLIILFTSCLLGTTLKAQYWTKNGTGLSASGVCVIDLSVPEDKVAWGILSVFSSGSCGGVVPYYTKTTNGSSWNAGAISLLPNITPVCISAISATTAWILASDISTNKVGYVYQTTNGGTNWNIQNSSYSPDAGRFIHFFDANEGITVGDSSIFRTMDGGINWIANGALPVDTSFLGSGSTNFILNSYEVVGNTIWLGDVYGYIYKSVDRGINWMRMPNTIFPNSIKGIAFKDSLYGMVVASHYVGGGSGTSGGTDVDESYYSIDGGLNWLPMPILFNSSNVDDLSAKYDVAYVPGTSNTFIVTSEYNAAVAAFSGISYDGGKNWSLLDSTEQHTVCVFTSPTNGYTGGYIPNFNNGIYKWAGNLTSVLNSYYEDENIALSPNPATDNLKLSFKNNQTNDIVKIQIFDTFGKVIFEENQSDNNAKEININLSNLSKGTYILKTTSLNKGNKNYKFIHL